MRCPKCKEKIDYVVACAHTKGTEWYFADKNGEHIGVYDTEQDVFETQEYCCDNCGHTAETIEEFGGEYL